MDIEKLVNSKITAFADWFIRLVLINVLMILTSLPIVTMIASISAGYNLLNDYTNNKHVPIVKTYFTYFKQGIGRKILFELLLIGIFLLGYTNIRYYTTVLQDETTWFYTIGYYVTLALVAMSYATTLYMIVIWKVNTNLTLKHMIKIAFSLAGKYYLITAAIVIINSLPVFLLFHPITMVLFIFAGISLPLLGNVLVTRHIVNYLERLGDNDDTTRNRTTK